MRNTKNRMYLSIVIPTYNEEQNVLPLYEKLKPVLKRTNLVYEIIFIDDGSTDLTLVILKRIAKIDNHIKIIVFRKNFGQTAAIAAGFKHARGNVVITLDADLQNDPNDIPKLINEINNGFDVVSGWRKNRKDAFVSKRIPSYVANWLISTISGIKLHDYGCTLKAYKKDILKEISLYGEMHRFIPAIAASVGARVGEVEVDHHQRKFGKSKYGIDRTLRVILDLVVVKFILSYQFRPIQLFGKIGSIISLLGVLIFLVLIYQRFIEFHPLSSRPLFVVSVFLILVGIQFVTIGLLAEITVRTSFESRDKLPYFIKEII